MRKNENIKLIFGSILALAYSNMLSATNCDNAKHKALAVLAKTINVKTDEIAIDKTFYEQSFETDVLDIASMMVDLEEKLKVELSDEDIVDQMLHFDEAEFELKLNNKLTVKEFQEFIYNACSKPAS